MISTAIRNPISLVQLNLVCIFGLVLVSLASVSSAIDDEDKYESIQLILSSSEGPQLYRVALDRIGIVLNPFAKAEQIDSLSNQFELRFTQSFDGGFNIATLPKTLDRKSINDFVKDIRQNELVVQAGPLLLSDQDDSPMLVTDSIAVAFKVKPKESLLKEFTQIYGVTAVRHNKLIPRMWLMRINDITTSDALDTVRAIMDRHKDVVDFAVPNFVIRVIPRQAGVSEPLFGDQWYHKNIGQSNGTFDADTDSDLAWSLSEGDENTVIAIMDFGFRLNHSDFAGNLWQNSGEDGTDSSGISKRDNNCDDDGNGFDDDFHGYNFWWCAFNSTTQTCPTNNTGGSTSCPDTTNDFGAFTDSDVHGTHVAGVAAARGDNGLGVAGMCPKCSLMLLQFSASSDTWIIVEAITYAGLMGADILSNSWGLDGTVTHDVILAISETAATGTIIFWSMDNSQTDDCQGTNAAIHTNPNVIPVSASSNWDKKVTKSGFGDCLGILASSWSGFGPNYTGTLNTATTDRPGAGGYNNSSNPAGQGGYDPSFCNTGSDTGDLDYTLCFGGTSAATPLVAGVAGLVLTIKPDLDTTTMEQLLQDTADKIEPSIANYGVHSGKSNSNSSATSTHGYGRVNAYEALKVVSPFTHNGQTLPGGTDLFIRDNNLDWGNTAQEMESAPAWRAGSNVEMGQTRSFIPHYRSVDIKIDAPPYDPNPPVTPTLFDNFNHENPISGAINKVFVRVRNRGPRPATNVRVKLHWTWAGTALPQLPADFWTSWPADSTDQTTWHSLGMREIPMVGYSGASVAGTNDDQSQIATFDFTGPDLDPALPSFRHHCLLAIIDSAEDPVRESRRVPDVVTPTNNNVTHRNVAVQDGNTSSSSSGLMIRNPYPWRITTRLKIIKPKRWEVKFSKYEEDQIFRLAGGEEIPITVKIVPDRKNASGEVEIRQEIAYGKNFQSMGGYIYRFRGGRSGLAQN
jgi:hypothetical protein